MAKDVKKYATELAQEAGLSKEATEALLQAVENEKVSKRLSDDLMRHDEFSRSMDGLRTKETELGQEKDKWNEWHTKASKQFKDEEDRARVAEGRVKAYETQYGELSNDDQNRGQNANPNPNGNGQYMSREDFDKYVKEQAEVQGKRDSAYLFITREVSRAVADHQHRFGEPLDLDALETFAKERQLNVKAAYQEMIAPKLNERQAKEFEDKLKVAREEGARDALTLHHIPIDTKPRDHHVFYDRKGQGDDNKPLSNKERIASFVEAVEKAGAEGAQPT